MPMLRRNLGVVPLCSRVTACLGLAAYLGLAACGGAPADAQTPADVEEPPAPPEPEETEAPEEDESAEEESAEDTEEPPAEEEAKPLRSPKDVITTEGVLFTFSFNDSDVYQPTQDKCTAQAKGDPKKKAKCVAKVVAKFDGDGMTFRAEKDGTWTWLTIRRRGKSLKALHKIQVEFGEETDKTIVIKPKGRDKGSKPKRFPPKVVIHVPSSSEIYIEDPKHGKMVYVAKHGLLGEAER